MSRLNLQIEQLRLGNRLHAELVVSEAARLVLIPILSIQPPIENAVKHGIAAKSGSGRVCLKAELAEPGLQVTVEDTCLGFEWSKMQGWDGTGVALETCDAV